MDNVVFRDDQYFYKHEKAEELIAFHPVYSRHFIIVSTVH